MINTHKPLLYTRVARNKTFSAFVTMKLFLAVLLALVAFAAPAAAQYHFGRATFYGVDGCKYQPRLGGARAGG